MVYLSIYLIEAAHCPTIRDGLKIRIITYAKGQLAVDFSTIAGDTIFASDVQHGRRCTHLIYWMVQCR